jgi:4-alpha-glucanotransferase
MILYTGTHDNNTLRGWFEEDIGPYEKDRIASVLGRMPTPDDVSRTMISLALDSNALTVIVPVQDLLSLSSGARMNRPATTEGNWCWRLSPGEPGKDDWEWLRGSTIHSERASGFFSRDSR